MAKGDLSFFFVITKGKEGRRSEGGGGRLPWEERREAHRVLFRHRSSSIGGLQLGWIFHSSFLVLSLHFPSPLFFLSPRLLSSSSSSSSFAVSSKSSSSSLTFSWYQIFERVVFFLGGEALNSSIIVPPPSPKKPAPEKKLPKDSSGPYYVHVNLAEKVLGLLLRFSTFTSSPLIFHALPSLSHPPPPRLCCIAESGCGEGRGIEEERNSRHLCPGRRGGRAKGSGKANFFCPLLPLPFWRFFLFLFPSFLFGRPSPFSPREIRDFGALLY